VAHPLGRPRRRPAEAPPLSLTRHPLIIGGARPETAAWGVHRSPADDSPVAEVALADAADVDRAVQAAQGALGEWAALGATGRGEALHRFAALFAEEAGDVAELMHLEMGKPVAEARLEVARAAEVVRHFAAEPERLATAVVEGPTPSTGSWVRPVPLGVVAAITPWNFPVALVVWKLAPALAAGCTVVVKPAIEAPLSPWAVVDIAERSGLPPGCVNVVNGDGPLIGEALCTHPGVAKVAFTGSRRVAEIIAGWAAPRLKSLSLELGGHGPLVVLPDADLDVAVDVAITQGYVNAGQACYSVNRVLVPPALRDGFLERFRARMGALEIGPMATERGLARHRDLLADARAKGARVEGGEDRGGRFVAPALVTGARPGVRVADEEPFTPLVTVMEAGTVEDAVAEANRPDFGLVGYVVGDDLRRALDVAHRIRCGSVIVNGWRVVLPYAPFSGWRGSGVGAELGRPGLEAFVHWQHLRVL
jgi:succinate-semialdehyde dehydrogenase / glutarate-semialdehyde dehydrogenase